MNTLLKAITGSVIFAATMLWFSPETQAQVPCTLPEQCVAIPNPNDQLFPPAFNLPFNQRQKTGKTGVLHFSSCGNYSFTAARFAKVKGIGNLEEAWDADPGAGKKFSSFIEAGGYDSCTVGGVQYTVYRVLPQ